MLIWTINARARARINSKMTIIEVGTINESICLSDSNHLMNQEIYIDATMQTVYSSASSVCFWFNISYNQPKASCLNIDNLVYHNMYYYYW